MKYYKCNRCGNILGTIEDGNVIPKCCNEEMTLLSVNQTDDAHEIEMEETRTLSNNKKIRVCIGKDTLHPMSDEHYIKFINLITDKTSHIYFLDSYEMPCINFYIGNKEKILKINAYCNIHGLYELDIA